MCKAVLEAAKRITRKTVNKKATVRIEAINKIYEVLDGDKCSLLNLRTILIIVLAFPGFLRYSELALLRRSGFVFQDTQVEIFIEKSKTDTYRDGHWLFLAKLDTRLCPVKLLKRYFKTAK